MKLASIKVDSWMEFAKWHGIDLSCECNDINGYHDHPIRDDNECLVIPVGLTAYDSGYEVAGHFPRIPYPKTVAFAHEGRIGLAFNGEAGEEETPFLAMAWLNLFPNCEWLPEQFGDFNSIPDYYAHLPPEDAERLVQRIEQSVKLELERSSAALQKIEGFKKNPPPLA